MIDELNATDFCARYDYDFCLLLLSPKLITFVSISNHI